MRFDILNGLERPGRCLRIFLSGPNLKLTEQRFGSWLILGLILKCRFKSGKEFSVWRGPGQVLSGGG